MDEDLSQSHLDMRLSTGPGLAEVINPGVKLIKRAW